LFAARHLLSGPDVASDGANTKTIRVADIGSGAGFPGIPLKLWRPEISLTLVESNHKKATFLREVGRTLTLTDINILNVRAEDVPVDQRFDVVTLRAVERFDDVLPHAYKLVAVSGVLGLLIGDGQVNRTQTLTQDFDWKSPVRIPQSRSRVLLMGCRRGRNPIGQQVGQEG
jgi:16S rRNA (guanine527-N7)-methyltransferase